MALAKPLELLEYPKALCATTQLVTANVMARKDTRMEQWAISSQASGKPVEGSTTTLSILRFRARKKGHERGVVFACEIDKLNIQDTGKAGRGSDKKPRKRRQKI